MSLRCLIALVLAASTSGLKLAGRARASEGAVASEASHRLSSASLSLEHSAAAQVVRNRLSSARAHLKDVELRIEDYTNQVEMGVRKEPGWNKEDAAALPPY